MEEADSTKFQPSFVSSAAVVEVLQRAAGRKAAESSVRHSGQQGALLDSTRRSCDYICKTIGSFLTSVFQVLLMS